MGRKSLRPYQPDRAQRQEGNRPSLRKDSGNVCKRLYQPCHRNHGTGQTRSGGSWQAAGRERSRLVKKLTVILNAIAIVLDITLIALLLIDWIGKDGTGDEA